MKISRRRFVQGLAATLVAAPLLRSPAAEPELDPWIAIPDPRTRWDHPDSDPIGDIRAIMRQIEDQNGYQPPMGINCRCVRIRGLDANGDDLEETITLDVEAEPYSDGNVVGWLSGPIDLPSGWTIHEATLKLI